MASRPQYEMEIDEEAVAEAMAETVGKNANQLETMLMERVSQYTERVSHYMANVKQVMRTAPVHEANECFEQAIRYLTQDMPDLKSVTMEESELEQEFKRKLLEHKQREEENASEAVGAASASVSSTTLSLKTTIPGKWDNDAEDFHAIDIKLLPSGQAVVADYHNSSVKLFTMQGHRLQSLKLECLPHRLAVIDPAAGLLAVTLTCKNRIVILEVKVNALKIKSSLDMSSGCYAIAAINRDTLAVGYNTEKGIDIVDMSGQVLRRLSDDLNPEYMAAMKDGSCLVMSTTTDRIAKVEVADGSVCYCRKVSKIKKPGSISIRGDGSYIVASKKARSLHLVTSGGVWEQELWRRAFSKGKDGELWCASELKGMCVTSPIGEPVYVLEGLK